MAVSMSAESPELPLPAQSGPSTSGSHRTKLAVIGGILVLIVILLLVGNSILNNPSPGSPLPSSSDTTSLSPRTYSNTKYGFSVVSPNGWLVIAIDRVGVGDENTGIITVVSFRTPDGHELGSSFVVKTDEKSPATQLDEYAATYRSKIIESSLEFGPLTFGPEGWGTVGPVDYVEIMYTRQIGSSYCKIVDTVLDGAARAYVLSFGICKTDIGSADALLDKYLPLYRKVLQTFRLL